MKNVLDQSTCNNLDYMKLSWLLVVALGVFILGFFTLGNTELLVDEKAHYAYVLAFIDGNYALPANLPTLPGYHILLTTLAKITGTSSITSFRLFSVSISFATTIVFLLILREKCEPQIEAKFLHFLFLPILFPFYFLIYTDVLSLLFILTALLCLFTRHTRASVIFSLLAVLVRQNNIMWVAFLTAYLYVETYGFTLKKEYLRAWIRGGWPYFSIMVGFLLFFILNGGAAIGDLDAHPSYGLHVGNIIFLLFIVFFLLLPQHIANLRRIRDLFSIRTTWITVAVGFAFYILLFENTHEYNVEWGRYFPRNWVLITFTSSLLLKTILFFPLAISALSLWVTPFDSKSKLLLFVFTSFFLLPSWLVETRYLIIPLTMLILFNREESKVVAWATVLWWMVLSAVVLLGISRGRFFL